MFEIILILTTQIENVYKDKRTLNKKLTIKLLNINHINDILGVTLIITYIFVKTFPAYLCF